MGKTAGDGGFYSSEVHDFFGVWVWVISKDFPFLFESLKAEMGCDFKEPVIAGFEERVLNHDGVAGVGVGPDEGDAPMCFPERVIPEIRRILRDGGFSKGFHRVLSGSETAGGFLYITFLSR